MTEPTEEFQAWHRVIIHPTLAMAWQAGGEHEVEAFRDRVIRMIKQEILIERDSSMEKLAEAVREL